MPTFLPFYVTLKVYFIQCYLFFTDCRYLGKYYKAGEIFSKGDNCNSCTCTVTGDVTCDNRSCSPVVTTTMPPLPTKVTLRFIGTGQHLTLLSSLAKAVNETKIKSGVTYVNLNRIIIKKNALSTTTLRNKALFLPSDHQCF